MGVAWSVVTDKPVFVMYD